jgi:hypothetical protein
MRGQLLRFSSKRGSIVALLAARSVVEHELQATGRAGERFVAERADGYALRGRLELRPADRGDVEVAEVVIEAAERERPTRVDPDEPVAEQPAKARDQLLQVVVDVR